jgi:hypothetical protein
LPAKAKKALESAMPEKKMKYRLARRVAGVGSLGRPRFVALAELNKSLIACELKALVPSACVWARSLRDDRSQYGTIVEQAIRCPDPFPRLHKAWVVRRLAPDCSRVDLSMLLKGREESKLLEAMGRETANVHLGSGRAITKVKRDFNKRPPRWLNDAGKIMVQATTEDWREWCDQGTSV